MQLLAAALALSAAAAADQGPLKLEDFSQGVYQVLTDRFASPNLLPAAKGDGRCWNLTGYCGGTFRGLLDQADYIKGLNLGAVWSTNPTVQSYGGYHGYWPLDLFAINPNFGSPADLERVLRELEESYGLRHILDVVLNHIGYTTWPLGTAPNPFDKPEYFHACDPQLCDPEGCAIPEQNTTLQQRWTCRLSWLPDLNQSHPFVAYQSTHWIEWMLSQFRYHALRVDAGGYVNATFWPGFVNSTGMPAWLETVPSPIDVYEEVRDGLPFSFQAYEMYSSTLSCFASQFAYHHADDGCMQLSSIREYLGSIGADTRRMLTFCEGHDVDRFLTIRNSTAAYKNALAHTLLSEAIPLIYYGAEQGMEGGLFGQQNRAPLWHVGYNTSNEFYVFIRTLAWYRREMSLPSQPFQQAYVDNFTYAFSRGPELLVVLTSGLAPNRPASYPLANLTAMAGTELCDVLLSGYCVTVGDDGTAAVEPSPTDQPLVLATRDWLRPAGFFVPAQDAAAPAPAPVA